MPRYFFHVYHERTEVDCEGEELPDNYAAWHETTVMAGQLYKIWMATFSRGANGVWK